MNRLLAIVAIVFAIALCIFFVPKNSSRADFIFVNQGDVFTLDPQRMSWLTDMQAAYCLYEGLLRWNTKDFSIEPAAATHFNLSEDGRIYTFFLRKNGRWNNGAKVTAFDFRYAWMRLLTPDTASDYSSFLFAIDGAKKFWNLRTEQLKSKKIVSAKELQQQFNDLVGIRVIDEFTIEITLNQPVPYFTDQIALAVCSPVYRPAVEGWILSKQEEAAIIAQGWHNVEPPTIENCRWLTLDKNSGRFQYQYYWARPGTLVSNGPFELDVWRYKRDMLFVRNPYYHSQDNLAIDSIKAITMVDPNTAVFAFENGEVDWLSSVNVDYQSDILEEKQEGKRNNIHALPTFGTDFFSFNCRETLNDGSLNPFSAAAVRRAFVYATDRTAIVKHATRLNEPVLTSLVPPNSIEGYTTVNGLGFNPKKAVASLKDSGWEDRDKDGILENNRGELFPIIDLLYTTNTPRYKWIALFLRDQWESTLGVRVQLRGTDNKLFSSDLKNGNFMIARGRWYGDYGDPTTFLDVFRSNNGNNDRGYSNPEIDLALNKAAIERDPKKRMAMLHDVENKLFNEEVPMLVLCQLLQLYMYDPEKIEGLTVHPRLVQHLWRVNKLSGDQQIDTPHLQTN